MEEPHAMVSHNLPLTIILHLSSHLPTTTTVPASLVDVDECNMANPCGPGTCTNLVCGYNCSCQPGYKSYGLIANNVTCIGMSFSNYQYSSRCNVLLSSSDIDECALSSLSNCSSNATCSNTVGSYICTCKQGFSGNGRNCTGMVYGSFYFTS